MKKSLKKLKSKLLSNARISLYTKYTMKYPVQKNTIFYHAYRTRIMAGNPYAIFKALLENEEKYGMFVHFWVYTNEESLEYDTFKRYKNLPNVKLVRANSKEHMKALATCQYFVENAALPAYWQKREGQIYINTWHGTPLKTLGKSAKDSSKASISNAQRNFFMCDYMVMPNRYTIEKMLYSYDLNDLISCNIVDAGYPRNDLVVNTDTKRLRSLLEKKCGKSLKDKKIVLYAPTFRSKKGKSLNTAKEVCGYIEQMVETLPDDHVMFFKVHNTLGTFFRGKKSIENNLIFDEIETNELLSVTDILITDYSSIFFDFLCTGRPILFFVYDREEYESEHGMYLELDTMPGALCYTPEEVIEQIETIKEGAYHCDQYEKNVELFAYNDDGNASERVLEIVFGDGSHSAEMERYRFRASAQTQKKRMLISLDEDLNLGTQQLLYTILRQLDYQAVQVIIACTRIEQIWEQCEAINPQIRIFSSEVIFSRTWKERIFRNETADFYRRQKEKYFFNIEFDQYLNLKNNEAAIDAMIGAFPDIKKYWLVNEHPELSGTLAGNTLSYEEIYLLCNTKDELPDGIGGDCTIVEKKELISIQPEKMTVLCMAAFDSMNYALAECVEELQRRGHDVIVVVKDINDQINNKMYLEKQIKLVSIDDFDMAVLNFVDVILTAPIKFQLFRKVYVQARERGIFMCSFSNLFSSIVMRVTPDIIFCLGENKFQELKDNNLRYNCVAIGNPQYDALIRRERKRNSEIEKVLVVDQGGYPYGESGKRQLADTLIRIAKQNPQMTFEIKPRYLQSERGQTTHRVSEHLFDYFHEMPENLRFITVPTILEEIAVDYDAMITTWSTAYLDALMVDMPLILIAGLDSEDVFDVRSYRVRDAYQYLSKTGCVYDYRELGDLKTQFKVIDPEYVKKEVYDYKTSSSDKIVDFLEFCKKNLILKNQRLAPYFNMNAAEFYENFDSLKKETADSFSWYIQTRYLDIFNNLMQEYVYQNRCMGSLMDLSPMENYYSLEGLDEVKDADAFLEKKKAEIENSFMRIKNEFFRNPETIKMAGDDKILQDFYFEWLYDTGQYDKIINCKEVLLAPESREYYLGLIELRKNKKRAYRHLFQFLDAVFNSDVLQLLKEKRLAKYLKPFRTGFNKFLFYWYLYRMKKFELVEYLDQASVERNAATTWFKMKGLNLNGEFERCRETYQRYNAIYQKQKKKNSTLKGKAKFFVKQIVNQLVIREYNRARKKR